MNCKPGDIALITRQPYAGFMVEVLYAAPMVDHRLPDGKSHESSSANSWVVKSLGSPFVLRQMTGKVMSVRTGYYGSCLDSALRPLPGELNEDESVEERCEAL